VVIANDPGSELAGELVLELCRADGKALETVSHPVRVAAHGSARFRVEELLGRFFDTAFAYRFGPPAFDSVRVALVVAGEVVSNAARGVRDSEGLNPAPRTAPD
jgi:beta-mannosidase